MNALGAAGRLLSFAAIILAAACAESPELLPDPGPPTPRAPAPPPARQPEQKVARPAPSEPQVPPPAFAVAVIRADGGRRSVDGPLTNHAVSLLGHNGLAARPAPAPADLPPAIGEAAMAAAASEKGAPPAGEVFILGEISIAAPAGGGASPRTQVRIAAVDRRSGKAIGECGFQSPTAGAESILQSAMEDLLGQVMVYWGRNPPAER